MASYFFYIATASVAISASGGVTAELHESSVAAVANRSATAAVTAELHESSVTATAERVATGAVTAELHEASGSADNGFSASAALTAEPAEAQGFATAERVAFDADVVAAAHTTSIAATTDDAVVIPIGYEWVLPDSIYHFEIREVSG